MQLNLQLNLQLNVQLNVQLNLQLNVPATLEAKWRRRRHDGGIVSGVAALQRQYRCRGGNLAALWSRWRRGGGIA